MKPKDITGQNFGKLTAICYDHSSKWGRYWLFKCDCGNEKAILWQNVRRGISLSCGCSHYQMGSSSKKWTGYGEISGTHWGAIKLGAEQRSLEFSVTIQQAWELFLKQDRKCALSGLPLKFGHRSWHKNRKKHPLSTASLDRIDSSKGYTEGNIQWVHKDINLIKIDFDQSRFLELCCLVAQKFGYKLN